ncbi:lppC lipofamily protein, partial [Escherichia coli 88.1467]
ARHKPRLAI